MKTVRALRVLRGGAWNNNSTNCRAAYRNNNNPDNRNNNYGVRLVRAPAGPNPAVGTAGACAGESRPGPAMAATPSKHTVAGSGSVGPWVEEQLPAVPQIYVRSQQAYYGDLCGADCLVCRVSTQLSRQADSTVCSTRKHELVRE